MDTNYHRYGNSSEVLNQGDGMDSVVKWHANVLCVLVFISMFGLRAMVTYCGKPKCVKPEVHLWLWRKLMISFIHALIVGSWDIICLCLYPDLLQDPLYFINRCIYMLPPFSVGYFMYDFVEFVIIFKSQVLKEWVLILHHILVILTCLFLWNSKIFAAGLIIGYAAEVNTVFLHLRKLFQFCQVPFDSVIYRTVSTFNLITLIIFRVLPFLYLNMKICTDYYKRIPIEVSVVLGSFFVGLLIHLRLLWQIIKSDVLKPMFTPKLQKLKET